MGKLRATSPLAERRKERQRKKQKKKEGMVGRGRRFRLGLILIMLNFRILMLQGNVRGNSDNARINILLDLTVVMTFGFCYNKLDKYERTSALAERANSSLTHFGRKGRVKFRFNFR
jgi:hypothetical protein